MCKDTHFKSSHCNWLRALEKARMLAKSLDVVLFHLTCYILAKSLDVSEVAACCTFSFYMLHISEFARC